MINEFHNEQAHSVPKAKISSPHSDKDLYHLRLETINQRFFSRNFDCVKLIKDIQILHCKVDFLLKTHLSKKVSEGNPSHPILKPWRKVHKSSLHSKIHPKSKILPKFERAFKNIPTSKVQVRTQGQNIHKRRSHRYQLPMDEEEDGSRLYL